jgi:hypothetical protein
MFNNPRDHIKAFYIDSETNLPIETKKMHFDIKSLCKPSTDWIFEKCLQKNSQYREMIEENHKKTVTITDPLILKYPELVAIEKKRIFNDIDNRSTVDLPVLHTGFMNCSIAYVEACTKFYETKSSEEKFEMI